MASAEDNFAICCTLFQFFGLLFFSVKKLSVKTIDKYPNIPYTIYFFLLFILMTTEMAIFMFYWTEGQDESLSAKNALNYIMQHSVSVGLVLVLCTCFIQSYATTPALKKIIMNFIHISNICRRDFQHTVDYKSVRTRVFTTTISLCFMQIAILLLVAFYESHFNIANSVARLLFGIFPVCFLQATIIRFIFFVSSINCVLHEMTVVVEKTFVRFSNSGIVIVTRCENLDEKIKSLKKILNLLLENAELMNKSFGATILLSMFIFVIGLTTTAFSTFLALVGKLPPEKYGDTASVVIQLLVALNLYVLPCDCTLKNVSQLQATLNSIECELDYRGSTVQALRSLNLQLSLQPIQFTVAGYYTINRPFLAGIFTGIASYLIILVQFYTS